VFLASIHPRVLSLLETLHQRLSDQNFRPVLSDKPLHYPVIITITIIIFTEL